MNCHPLRALEKKGRELEGGRVPDMGKLHAEDIKGKKHVLGVGLVQALREDRCHCRGDFPKEGLPTYSGNVIISLMSKI